MPNLWYIKFSGFFKAEDIEEILAEIDPSQMEDYKKFFNQFDKEKKGYVMVIQVGLVMDAMQQDYEEKTMRKIIRKFDADGKHSEK